MIERIGQLFGNYRLKKPLGSGGFADVYLAEHVYLNTLAAVKLLHADLTDGDMQRFREEAITIARLSHPHIVRVLDFGIQQDIPYLVMEYAPNGTLRQRHPKETQVALSRIVAYVKQLASALQYAHEHRLIHRDVKPENVLLGPNNELLLSDFGAALITRTSLVLKTQAIIGTVSYMALEQLRGKPVQASDQYALGVMVYEWLCGHCPFEGAPAVVYNLQLNEPPPSLRAILPALPIQVEQVVMKALARYPEQRFVNVQAFADALEDVSKYVQDSPLFLAHDANSQGPSGITQLSPLPPTIIAPPPVVHLPETVVVSSPLSQPLRSRRALLRSIAGLTVVGGGGGIAWLLLEEGKQQSRAKKTQPTPSPTVKPSPTATPVPTKKDAVYTYTGHKNSVFTVAWAPNDQYIASAGGNSDSNDPAKRKGDTGVHVWAPNTGQVEYIYPSHTMVVRMVAWSPLDDQRIASASEDSTVQVWNALTFYIQIIYTGHKKGVMAVSWNKDGTRIASGSLDKTVQIWDAATGNSLLPPFEYHIAGVTSVAWSPDGTRIASASLDGVVYVWDSSTGTVLDTFQQSTVVGSISWSPDNRFIATGDYNNDDRVRIWDVNTGNSGRVFPAAPKNPINTVAWSPGGNNIAAGYTVNEVKIWHVPTGEQKLTYLGHTLPIMSVQWSHSRSYIASGGFDKTVQVWTCPDI